MCIAAFNIKLSKKGGAKDNLKSLPHLEEAINVQLAIYVPTNMLE